MDSVVFVERRVLIRELMTGALESAGYLVFPAGDLEEASELVAGVAPCLLVVAADADASADLAGVAALWSSAETPRPMLLLHDQERAGAAEAVILGGRGITMAEESFDRQAFATKCQELAPVVSGSKPTPAASPPTAPAKQVPASNPKPAASSPPAAKPKPKLSPVVKATTQIDEVGLLKTLSPVVSRDQVDEATERGVRLPLDEKVAAQVAAAIDSESTSPAELCRAVARDAALTLRVLASAGAASAGQREPVGSLSRAIDRIGKAGIAAILKQAEEHGSIAEASGRFEQALKRCEIDRRASWRHGHAVALIAGEVTRLTGGTAEAVQSARTAGWLHDLGRLVMAYTLTEPYAEACEAAVALGLPLTAVENQMVLDNNGQLAEKMLRSFKLAPSLPTSIGCHQLPLIEARNLSGKYFQETIALAIADRYAAALGTGHPIADPLRGIDHHLAALKIDAAKLAASLDACSKQLETDVAAFEKTLDESSPAEPPWWASLDAGIRDTLSAVFIGSDTQNDTFAVLAKQLTASVDTKPAVAIVRLTNVRERDLLTGKLRSWEFEQGVSRLPLLIVSPKGNLALEDTAMNGRAVKNLAEPVLPRQLASALNEVLQPGESVASQAA
ncbi:MAG: HDOD domain-containing protein [Planctomycetota bacterium]